MNFSLKDKRILVTGACGLIGKAIIQSAVEGGAYILAADIREGDIEGAECIHLDVTDESDVRNVLKKVLAEPLDGLVNCAYPRTKDWGNKFEDVNIDSLGKNIDMQLNSVFLCCQIIAESMKKNKKGSIVNIGSMHGVVAPNFHIYENTGMTSPAGYSIIKSGIIHFTKYLASYYGSTGVRINCVSPGGIFDNQDKLFVERYAKLCPMERMGTPEEIAGPVMFLLSDAASYVTGHNLVVDGGWTIC